MQDGPDLRSNKQTNDLKYKQHHLVVLQVFWGFPDIPGVWWCVLMYCAAAILKPTYCGVLSQNRNVTFDQICYLPYRVVCIKAFEIVTRYYLGRV